jgi:hypothetical protein
MQISILCVHPGVGVIGGKSISGSYSRHIEHCDVTGNSGSSKLAKVLIRFNGRGGSVLGGLDVVRGRVW